MAEKKLIKKDYFYMLREIAVSMERQDLVDFIDHEIELLDKKSSSKSLTKTQIENEKLKEIILETLRNLNKYATISEIQNANKELLDLKNQKITALLTQLKNDNLIIREVDKKKAYFKIAGV